MDLAELERQAKELLPPAVYDYFAGGSFDELTLAANVEDWARLRLRPRVLRDVTQVSTATTVLGTMLLSLSRANFRRRGCSAGQGRATRRARAGSY